MTKIAHSLLHIYIYTKIFASRNIQSYIHVTCVHRQQAPVFGLLPGLLLRPLRCHGEPPVPLVAAREAHGTQREARWAAGRPAAAGEDVEERLGQTQQRDAEQREGHKAKQVAEQLDKVPEHGEPSSSGA